MGILTKLLGGKNLLKSVRQPFSAGVSSLYSSMSNVFSNKTSYITEYRNWVYSCVTARAEDVSNIELKLFRGDQEVFEHPVLDLLYKVNPYMTKHDLFLATQSYKDLDGNCFWYLAREEKADGKGEVKEIFILKPDRVQIVCSKDNPLEIIGYIYTQSDGKKIPFEATEIIHHKNFNPNGPYPFPHRGMGVVEAAYIAIHTDNEMRMYNAAFFKNSARPDGMLVPSGDGTMSPEEYKRLKEEWSEEHRGSSNAHKVAILQGGMKWESIGSTQSDMQFIDQKRFNRDEILALFRVPKTLLGLTEDVNRANADAAIYVFSLKVIKPLMEAIVDTMNEFLLPSFGDDKLYFKFVSPVPSDRDAERADNTAALDKWMTRNEIREKLGLPPTQNGNEFMGTMAQIAIDNVVPEKKKSKAEKAKKSETAAEIIVDKFVAKLPTAEKTYREIEAGVKNKYIEIWKNNFNDISEAPLKKKLKQYFERQQTIVLRNLRQELKGLDKKEYHLKSIGDIIFDKEQAITTGISLITPFIRDYIRQSGKDAVELTGETTFDTETPRIERFVPQRAEYFAESITQTTADELIASIQEGIDNGEDLDAISERVASVYGKARDYRTDVIARTEVAASANFGAVEAYQQAGIEKHQWIVVNPEDDDCLVNDGAVAKIGDNFPDGSSEAPIHPNCQCTTIPVFEDD